MMRRPLLLSLLALLALLPVLNAATGTVSYSIFAKPAAGIDIDAHLAWEEIPFDRAGFYPIQIRITNKSPRDGRWEVNSQSTSGYYQSSTSLRLTETLDVPAGETRTFRLLCPLADDQYNNELHLTFTGTGIDEYVYFSRSARNRHRGSLVHFGGMSEELFLEIGHQLQRKIDSLGEEIQYLSITTSIAPEDWRAYMAFDSLYFSQTEWEGLTPSSRRAVMDYVMAGGQLRVLVGERSMDTALSDIPAGSRTRAVGLGNVILFNGDIHTLEYDMERSVSVPPKRSGSKPTERIAIYDSSFDSFINFRFLPEGAFYRRTNNINEAFSSTDKMSQLLNKATSNKEFFEDSIVIEGVNFILIIISVIAFGVIVGPVNFFILARGRNRWRIFITIPAISLIFCALIVVSIIFSDGFGGNGTVSRLVIIDPVRKTKAYVQDELSVTGILMSGGFDIPDSATIRLLGAKLPESSMDASGHFQQTGDHFSGDYFASRRLQHNRLINVTPSREAIILQGSADAPELVSNLQASCQQIFYIDDQGQFWKAGGLGVGQTAKAMKSSAAEFNQWWRQREYIGGAPWMFSDYRGFAGRTGWFYAMAEPMRDAYPETLDSINWKDHQTIIAGPLVKKESI
ncbi:hypothetical protein [Cerasicoccus arenae]|uniref:Uncharacterized protein n=1 Tax=Cerasicoccus arenae TaxID=424488 RepID=A0A8J3GDN4_9BACT|nr:hypothetical protein [Cerasicoccus arenae]MBK1859582.1 hypothetical protein [Cerasicoccus arenae]GHB92858.1 hypothetical protein GCM10007047_05210 [Cerasicoccus arenae]